ncbi:DUF6752 domain-containing protein [Nocardioides mangrovicus]|uniref:DUF6752 domain-containing protein n=1 Tax=Nocardioides mangrovicus TaxID=2478913 RepID=UPI0011C48075|nr:DUF6752 domain-containing protein [Nocardioides mangrovicus]
MSAISVDERRLALPTRIRGPVVVRFDGRYVWSFVPDRDGARCATGRTPAWHVPWPAPLSPLLDGTATVRLEGRGNGLVHFEEPVAFRNNPRVLTLEDGRGARLSVDRAGHLTRVFGATDGGDRAAVVAGTARALADLRERVGIDAHLSYGALLGAVREGRMIDHDSDTDLAYLSRHTHPADVVRESYRIERELRALGWKVVRMSGADLKLFLPLDDGRSVHVDVFAAFHVGETFFQLGGRSGRLPASALTPASTVVLEGVELAAPADPAQVLAFLYGAGWRVPDPSFQPDDPPDGVRRLDGWLRGARTDVVEWNELFRDRRRELPRGGSGFARWVDSRSPAGSEVVDLGSGNGRDAVFLTRRGHRVRAYDYSGAAIRQTRRRLRRLGDAGAEVGVLPLNDLRATLLAAAELARIERPPTIYARQLLGCLDAEARDNLWLLCATALRRGGTVVAEFLASGPDAEPADATGLVRRLDPAVVAAEVERHGGRVDQIDVGPGEGFLDEPDPYVARLEARWLTTTQHWPTTSQKEPITMTAPTRRRLTGLPTWLRELARSVEENRRLNRRVAELTDVVAELLVPLADRDEARARELLQRYRESTLAP